MAVEITEPDPLHNELPKQYTVLGKIRSGGMGAIYKVENRFTKQLCAIKVMRPEGAHDEQLRKRFIVEAKAASLLKHPNICQTFDFGVSENHTLYLVMEFLEGISLEQKVNRDGPLPAAEAISIFQQVSAALSHAHDCNVIHRDLKPDNIMLSRNGSDGGTIVHIVDFGIAKVITAPGATPSGDGLTRNGALLGTPIYMSPEQALTEVVDCRSDIYSLGCVMYFALTGKPPFAAPTVMDILYQHVHKPPPEIDASFKVAPAMKSIIMKALEKKPLDRYQTMQQLATDLKKLTKGVAIEHRLLARDRKKIRQNIMLVLTFLLGWASMFLASMAVQNFKTILPKTPAKASFKKSVNSANAKHGNQETILKH